MLWQKLSGSCSGGSIKVLLKAQEMNLQPTLPFWENLIRNHSLEVWFEQLSNKDRVLKIFLFLIVGNIHNIRLITQHNINLIQSKVYSSVVLSTLKLCNQFPELFSSCKTETLYPLKSNSPFPLPPSPGNHHTTLSMKF